MAPVSETGAILASTKKPAMSVIRQQGRRGPIDATPTRIARMIRKVFHNEVDIRAWEDMQASDGKRLIKGDDDKLHWVPVTELVGESLALARQKRDEHIESLKHVIDYALTEDLYHDVPCPDCKLPGDAVGFIRAVADFEPPEHCEACQNVGTRRARKDDDTSEKAYRRISYWSKVLDDVLDCAKIRAGTSDQNVAYARLELKCRNLLVKFGNEKQTSLEGDDAEQGVRLGIIDAAMRFDPLRSEGATFTTVAYNWCRRNSRARHDWQKRAGVYAPSIEAMGTDEEGNGVANLVTSTDGGVATFEPSMSCGQDLQLDIVEAMGRLPEDQRAVIAAELKGLNARQIAAELKTTSATIRRLRSTAFATLRETLGGYVEMLRD